MPSRPKAYSYLRMSTDLQLKGDSRRRQLEASRAYAEAEGLELADDAQLEDIGISAFKGANAREGALRSFLDAIAAGTVEKGSYLIVESLDRLSREHILTAHALLLSIVRAGINVVTLMDNRVYRADDLNLVDLITSLVIMERAHEESKTKSIRVGAAWKNKRVRAVNGDPMTARCPAWLRLSSDRSSYEIIDERAEIVRQIFADTAAGLGMYSIATRLNKAGVPAFVGRNGWHTSYIAKTLDNRAVLGEFQPHQKANGKRIPDGEPISNYYPVIISDELFFQAQHSKSQRSAGGMGAGRKGPGYTNLFAGLANCAYCNSAMIFENKGAGSKGGTYLVCSGVRRGRSCEGTRWKYRDFEASFLAFVQELDLESIVSADDDAAKRKTLENELFAIRGELSTTNELMEKTYAVLIAGGSPDFVAGKLNELAARQSDLKTRLEAKEAEKQEFDARESRFYTSREEIKDLVTRLQGAPTHELYKVRAQIVSRLKVLVETLLIAPAGELPKMKRRIEQLRQMSDGPSDDVVAHVEQLAEQPDQSRRYFAIGFRNEAVRIVFPVYNDPLKFEQQIVTGRSSAGQVQGQLSSISVISPEGG